MQDVKTGDTIALCGLSDPIQREERQEQKIEELRNALEQMGLRTRLCPGIYADERTGVRGRAAAWMDCCLDEEVRAVFDISGGDQANAVLEYLDYDALRRRQERTPLAVFGYSDVTTVLNAVHEKTGIPTYLYQVRNITHRQILGHSRPGFRQDSLGGPHMPGVSSAGHDLPPAGLTQPADLQEIFACLMTFSCRMARGTGIGGVVTGGNIRCLLKLAGTPYMPDTRGKILFLESNGGDCHRTETALFQLRQMGVFRQAGGILLGTFTALDREMGRDWIVRRVLELAEEIPVAVTDEIGHGRDSACLAIGGRYELRDGTVGPGEESYD